MVLCLLQLLDRTIDCVFMADIVLNFFTGVYERGGVVMDQVPTPTHCV